MPRMLVIAALACGLALLGYLTWPGGSGRSDRGADPAAQGPVAASSAAASAGARAARSAPSSAPRFLRSEWGFRWDPSKPGIAASEADAAWLQAQGFPGPDVEQHLFGLSLPELESLAARGNQPATAIYAYRLARSGASHERVRAILDASAAEGSVYALKMAGDIFWLVDGFRDPVVARAYYGLQFQAGDQNGFTQSLMLARQLDQRGQIEAEWLKGRIWEELGAPAPRWDGVGARPGFKAFMGQWENVAREVDG